MAKSDYDWSYFEPWLKIWPRATMGQLKPWQNHGKYKLLVPVSTRAFGARPPGRFSKIGGPITVLHAQALH